MDQTTCWKKSSNSVDRLNVHFKIWWAHKIVLQNGYANIWPLPPLHVLKRRSVGFFLYSATTVAKSLQSCPALCDPTDGSPPGSFVPGILQARTLEWVAISFNAWEWKVREKLLSCVQILATPWTTAHQALPSMGFSRQEYWRGVSLPSPRALEGVRGFAGYTVLVATAQFCHCNVKGTVDHM